MVIAKPAAHAPRPEVGCMRCQVALVHSLLKPDRWCRSMPQTFKGATSSLHNNQPALLIALLFLSRPTQRLGTATRTWRWRRCHAPRAWTRRTRPSWGCGPSLPFSTTAARPTPSTTRCIWRGRATWSCARRATLRPVGAWARRTDRCQWHVLPIGKVQQKMSPGFGTTCMGSHA